MRGSNAKLLRRIAAKFVDAGHPVSYRKLKRGWVQTGRDKRLAMVAEFMRQGGIYFVAGELGGERFES